jgi:ribosome-associated protein
MDEIRVRLPIRLGQFVKLASLADSGAQARELIEDGEITVNDAVETHRGHRLADGDVVALDGITARVRATDD